MSATTRALVLFAHGARDPRWAEPMQRLSAAILARSPGQRVVSAFLELMEPSLQQVVDALAAEGVTDLSVLPVFWSGGGHVVRDLPGMLAEARARHPGIHMQVLPVLSDLPGVLDAVAAAALSLSDVGTAGTPPVRALPGDST